MGLLKFLKRVYTEEYDEFEGLEDIVYNMEMEDDESEEARDEISESVPKTDNIDAAGYKQQQGDHTNAQEERFDQLLNSVQAQGLLMAVDNAKEEEKEERKKEEKEAQYFQQHAVKLPNVTRKPKKLEAVNTDIYDAQEISDFVKSQCEVMREASERIETAMSEYSVVTEHFADIELLENAPEKRQREIAEAAERVDSLTVDRRIFKATESKLSNNAYHRMEMYEEEIPANYQYMQQQENYYEAVKRDMRMLEGERLGLRLEAKALGRRQLRIRSAATASILCLAVVFSIFVIAMIAVQDDENLTLFLVVTILGAILALGMFALLKMTQRQVLVTEIRLNKATNLLNKTKIKYVNAANTLDYAYVKYRVKSSYELGRKYELYQAMKEEQQKILRMTANLNEAEEELHGLLKRLGMNDVNIWLGQVKALYNRKEMVEVRHELMTQRQKLRSQIEYNEGRILEAKQQIKQATVRHPGFMQEALRIIDQYEQQESSSAHTQA